MKIERFIIRNNGIWIPKNELEKIARGYEKKQAMGMVIEKKGMDAILLGRYYMVLDILNLIPEKVIKNLNPDDIEEAANEYARQETDDDSAYRGFVAGANWQELKNQQLHWKPSRAQLGALASACNGHILNLDYLSSLYNDLKQLM